MSRYKTGTFLHHGDPPPTHRINLSLPPSIRYVALATEYKPQLLDITSLFDDLVLSFLPESYLPRIKWLARRFLRRVYDDEENEEIKGIAEVTGVEMYLVVALNVLLDVLMGCTSGAALSSPSSTSSSSSTGEEREPRMLHFRTLDWDMAPLRALLVNLEFVVDDDPDSPVLATSITYVGFVGVLTGVRRGLSVSLNFRPNHDGSSWMKQARFYGGHVAVLLGLRRSIPSVLRGLIIPRSATGSSQSKASDNDGGDEKGEQKRNGRKRLNYLSSFWRTPKSKTRTETLPLDQAVSYITDHPSTACYIVLSDGHKTTVLEKDRSARSTKTYSSTSFIVATNSDREMEAELAKQTTKQGPSMGMSTSTRQEHTAAHITPDNHISLLDFIGDSKERRECMQAKWNKKVADMKREERRRRPNKKKFAVTDPLGRTRSARLRPPGSSSTLALQTLTSMADFPGYREREPEPLVTVTLEELIAWTTTYPTTNEMTHFSAVMDPLAGKVLWVRVYEEQLDCGGLE